MHVWHQSFVCLCGGCGGSEKEEDDDSVYSFDARTRSACSFPDNQYQLRCLIVASLIHELCNY